MIPVDTQLTGTLLAQWGIFAPMLKMTTQPIKPQ
jgi:hypothetical protein